MTLSLGDKLFILLLLFGPAVLGLASLGYGIHILRRDRHDSDRSRDSTPLAVFCLLVTFGITACYGLVLLHP